MNPVTQAIVKVVGHLGGWSEKSKSVFYSEYTFAGDLAGADLISLLQKTKVEVGAAIVKLDDTGRMGKRRLPLQSLVSMTGEIADEVHFFPNLTQGASERFTFEFKDGRLVTIRLNSKLKEPNQSAHPPLAQGQRG